MTFLATSMDLGPIDARINWG